MSHGDIILAMFEKVCNGDNLFSVSYTQELRKSFLVPYFTTAMSLAWVWYDNRKKISRWINVCIAHLPHECCQIIFPKFRIFYFKKSVQIPYIKNQYDSVRL